MKKIAFLLLLTQLWVLGACSDKDGDELFDEKTENGVDVSDALSWIYGSWNLSEVDMHFGGVRQMESQSIVCTFSSEKVTVKKNADAGLLLMAEGEYDYSIDPARSTMEIGGASFTYRMDATSHSLILDSGSAVDGPVYTFHKMK